MAEITFNATFYYEQKLNQLKGLNEELYGDWTIADVALAFRAEGLTPEQHASKFAAVEGLSVSPDFDTPRYLQDKLAQLQSLDPELYGEWTVEDVAAAFQEAGLSPLEHFQRFGAEEGLQAFPAGYTGPAGLTEALDELQAANTAVADAAEALNVALGDDEDTPAEYAATAEGVAAAREDVQEAFDAVVEDRDNFRDTTVGEVVAADDSDPLAIGVDKYLGSTAKLTEANLNTALAGVQAEIDADETVFNAAGSAGVTPVYSYRKDGATVYTLDEEDETAPEGAEIKLVGYLEGVVTDAPTADPKDDLIPVYTLAGLQQEMLKAAKALEDARNVKSDADLLADITAAINAYLGAGGENVDVEGETLLQLRTAIAVELDTEEEYQLDADVTPTRDELLIALSGVDSLTSGAAVAVSKTAPEEVDGQGAWIKGNEVEVEVDSVTETHFEWTYQPTAEEQALLNALKAVEARDTLIQAEVDTKDAFEDAETEDGDALGAELLAIEGRLADLAALEEAVVTAEAEYDAANALIDALEAALDDLAEIEGWFADQGFELPVTIDGDVAGTEDSDIFLFAEDTDGEFTITGFGAEGDDVLYFGAGYTLTALNDASIEDRVGSNDLLEIFWEQSGDDLILYVEADAAAGFDRGELALSEMTQITLTGVSAEDVNFENGFLSLNQVEVA